MLLTEARRPARTGPRGELISLERQDRTCGDKDLITEGTTLISAALRQQRGGYYQLQAAIAAIHDEASTTKDTDWPRILAGNHRLDAVRAHLLERAGPNPRLCTSTARSQHRVELRGLEPLTPTLPVWCATSCATAPRPVVTGTRDILPTPQPNPRIGIPLPPRSP